jgi:hypothetical protein
MFEHPILQRMKTNSAIFFSDEYCPHCDNHFVLEALTPQANLHVEGDDARMDSRYGLPFNKLSLHLLIMIIEQDAQGRARARRSRKIDLHLPRYLRSSWLERESSGVRSNFMMLTI